MENFSEWMKGRGKRKVTILSYVQAAKLFQKWFLENKNMAFMPQSVSEDDLKSWKDYLINEATYLRRHRGEQKYSISSVVTFIKAIRCYFLYLTESGQISKNPARNIKPPKFQKNDHPIWLKTEERDRLLAYVKDAGINNKNRWRYTRNRAMLFLGLNAGLGRNEIVNCELSDISFEKGCILVRNEYGLDRVIDMDPTLRLALSEWIVERGDLFTTRLFISQKGGPITSHTLNKLCSSLGNKIDVKRLSPHVLRHTFGHELVIQGYSLERIAKILGHSNSNFTRIYKGCRSSS